LWRVLITALLVNSFSLPIVWFLIPHLQTYWTYWKFASVAEAFAVVSEAIMMKPLLPLSWRRAAATSFAQNMTSYAVGLALGWLTFSK
jgi:hypothetical protein